MSPNCLTTRFALVLRVLGVVSVFDVLMLRFWRWKTSYRLAKGLLHAVADLSKCWAVSMVTLMLRFLTAASQLLSELLGLCENLISEWRRTSRNAEIWNKLLLQMRHWILTCDLNSFSCLCLHFLWWFHYKLLDHLLALVFAACRSLTNTRVKLKSCSKKQSYVPRILYLLLCLNHLFTFPSCHYAACPVRKYSNQGAASPTHPSVERHPG